MTIHLLMKPIFGILWANQGWGFVKKTRIESYRGQNIRLKLIDLVFGHIRVLHLVQGSQCEHRTPWSEKVLHVNFRTKIMQSNVDHILWLTIIDLCCDQFTVCCDHFAVCCDQFMVRQFLNLQFAVIILQFAVIDTKRQFAVKWSATTLCGPIRNKCFSQMLSPL